MRKILPIFVGLSLAFGSAAISRADDVYKDKTKTKVEKDGDVKIKSKSHGERPGPDYKSKSKTKVEKDGDVKYKEKTHDENGNKVKTKEKIDR